MKRMWPKGRAGAALLLLLAMAIAGCAGNSLHQEGLALVKEGQEEAGLAKLEQALKQDPRNIQYRADLLRARSRTLERLMRKAQDEQAAGRSDQAVELYRQALRIDNRNQTAVAGLAQIERDKAHAEAIAKAQALEQQGDPDAAEPILRGVLLENPKNAQAAALLGRIDAQRVSAIRATPVLKPKLARPVSFEFRDASLKLVFDALTRTSGINFLLDKDVRADSKITVVLHDVHVEDAIDLIVMQSQLAKKVLSERLVLVYPPQKDNEYRDLMVKNFYLTNATAKETVNMLKTVLKTKDLYVNESINLVTMRDTPDALLLAEKLIAAQDLAEPEVLLEMELIEISRSRLLELGIQWTDTYTFGVVKTPPPFTISDLKNISASTITMTAPSATVTARKTDGDSNTLLNPRIRVRNREKARLVVADRVPVISAVVTSGTGNPVVTESVQYLEVGLKLEVQPSVHLDGKVTITVSLEVSNLGETVRTANGTVAYRVGTRNEQTVLDISDGETVVLGGLISDQDRKSATKIPGLGDAPVLGRLFGIQTDENKKFEILLSITPRVIANVVRPDARTAEFWSGSEATLRTRPMYIRSTASSAPAETVSLAAAAGPRPAEPAGAAAAAAAGPALAQPVSLVWQAQPQVKVGESFSVAVRGKSDEMLSGATVTLGFDPNALEIVQVSEGTFFKQGGATTTFETRPVQAAGVVTARITRQDGSGVAGDSELLLVTFKAKQANPQTQLKVLSVAATAPGNRLLGVKPTAPHVMALTP